MTEKGKRKKGLTPFDYFTLGFGAIIGVGWAVSINNWMASAGGPVPAALGYILSLVMLIPICLSYAELAPAIPVAGGEVAFAYKAFGQRMAFVSGWAGVGAYIMLMPWEAIYVNDILGMLMPWFKGGSQLYSVAGYPIYLRAVILGVICSILLFVFNWKGAKSSAKLQNTLCVILMCIAAIIIVAALFKANPANLLPAYENVGKGSHASFMGGLFAMFASIPFFMCGFESIPQAIEEADGDVRKVGKVVVAVVLSACLFYAVLLLVLGMAMPWKDFFGLSVPAISQMFRILYPGIVGKILSALVVIGALCGLFTTWNSFMVATPRLLMALGRAHLIPAFFKRTDAKTGVPTTALVICAVFAAAGPFIGTNVIDILTSFTSAAFVLCWLLTVFCNIRLRRTQPDLNRPFKMPGGSKLAFVGGAFGTVIFIMFFIPGSVCYITNTGVLMMLSWALIGAIFYLLSSKSRNAIPEENRIAELFAKMK